VRRAGLLALALALTLLVAEAPAPHAASVPEVVAIVGATVWTAPGKKLENATIVVANGKIAALGAGAGAPKLPADARRLDAQGQVVTAGFVDAYTSLGLTEVALEPSSAEGALEDVPGGDQVHSAYRVVDGYNAQSVAIPIARTGGVTSVVSVPGGGLVGGAAAWMSLVDGARPGDACVRAPAAMQLTLGSGARAVANGSRGMAVERARELLDDARAYGRRKGEFERNATRRFAASRLDLDALAPVLAGTLPLLVWADKASDVLSAIALGQEFGVRVVIAGGVEAWEVAPELARAKVPVLLDPTRNLPGSFDTLHVRDDLARRLADAGVTVVIATIGDGSVVRTLRQLCGIAIANGLSWDQALASVTTAPAATFGVARGTLAVGAAADLVVWSGDPFELSTRALHVLVGGVELPLRTRQTLLLERYRKL
jgi:imidazolonepropionase-like amidohydrolase